MRNRIHEAHFLFCDPNRYRSSPPPFRGKCAFKVCRHRNSYDANRNIYLTSAEIPQPGISTNERGGGSTTYMVSHRETKNNLDTFVDVNGQRRWGLSNGDNEATVMLTLAGLWKRDILLPGNINTLHDTPCAQELMRLFMASLRQEGFTKVDDLWWLGREALEMLKDGKRLTTTAAQSPPDFDLKWRERIDRTGI